MEMTDKMKTAFKLNADFFPEKNDENPTGIFDDKFYENCSPKELAQMRFALAWLESTTFPNGALAVYAPGPVTGGQVAYDAAAKIGVKNIAELPTKLSADEFYKQVIQPNVQRALLRGRRIQENLYPEKPVINPIGAEGSVRIMKNSEFSPDGKKWGQDAFMGVWLTVLDRRIDTMVLDNDWSRSNGSIQEVTHASLIQAGLRPCRPDADMKIVDMEKKPISLYDRASKIAEAVEYGLNNGFDVPIPATSLARMFHIHEMIKDGKIDPQSAHLDTFEYDSNDMEKLIAKLKPVLLKKCVGYMDIKDLGTEYSDAKHKLSSPSLQKAHAKATLVCKQN